MSNPRNASRTVGSRIAAPNRAGTKKRARSKAPQPMRPRKHVETRPGQKRAHGINTVPASWRKTRVPGNPGKHNAAWKDIRADARKNASILGDVAGIAAFARYHYGFAKRVSVVRFPPHTKAPRTEDKDARRKRMAVRRLRQRSV